jgi:hypothetical protein
MSSWKDLENDVRAAAGSIWGKQFKSTLVHGRQIDAYAELDDKHSVAIEVTEVKTIEKIQNDINKLIHVRNTNFSSQYKSTECLCVTAYEPTVAMRNVGKTINIDVISAGEFYARFLPFDAYHSARSVNPFGSAIDPETGKKDSTKYVVVGLRTETGGEVDAKAIVRDLALGHTIVLTGEYGTGKSKCIEYVYTQLAANAWNELRFPIAIDLRNCWGLRDRFEIIRRHLQETNLSTQSEAFVKAYNAGMLTLLLDGFDELGVQLWSDDSSALQALRAEALTGVRDLISHQSGRILIVGREHYFDSNEELLAALGLSNRPTEMLRSKEEFTLNEMAEFMATNNRSGDIPEWLPRKPLTVDFFLRVLRDVNPLLLDELNLVSFWEMLINAVCDREAKIHPSFNIETIKNILVEVAALTRNKSGNVGPLSLSEIQGAFERVVGHAPIEQASVLLQRLPGLGRTSADSEDRRFVDTYMLDGLRASHVLSIVERKDARSWDDNWFNPLSENGLLICGRKLEALALVDAAIALCRANPGRRNQTLALDIVSSALVSGLAEIDCGGTAVDGGHSSVLDFSHARVANLSISNSVIERMVVSSASVSNTSISKSLIGVLEGISSKEAIPSWMTENTVSAVSSIATTSRIRAANLLPTQKVLVTVLRKTFFQKGSGRKEEALLRGLGKLVRKGTLDKIVGKLISEGIISREKGQEGSLYIPVRSQMSRAGKILAQLSLCDDPIWTFVTLLTP